MSAGGARHHITSSRSIISHLYSSNGAASAASQFDTYKSSAISKTARAGNLLLLSHLYLTARGVAHIHLHCCCCCCCSSCGVKSTHLSVLAPDIGLHATVLKTLSPIAHLLSQVSSKELHALLTKTSLDGIPLLVLGNKNDLPGALGTQQLIDKMQLQVGNAVSSEYPSSVSFEIGSTGHLICGMFLGCACSCWSTYCYESLGRCH